MKDSEVADKNEANNKNASQKLSDTEVLVKTSATDTPTSHLRVETGKSAKHQSTFDTKSFSAVGPQKYDWQSQYSLILKGTQKEDKPYIPPYFRSSIMYVVLENELALKNKRRIVSLTVDDLLYATITGKCVFLQIDWHQDFNNVLKVHESNHTWETTFGELIDTRPIALRNLFSRSEIWAEGKYTSLA